MSDDDAQPRYPMVLVECTPEDAEVLSARLTLLGAESLEERDASTLVKGGPKGVTLVASFADFESARAAAEELGPDARVDELVGDEWRDGWKKFWAPTPLGSRVIVVPSWIEYEPAPEQLVLRLDPGRAFGTGQHASTYLAASALEQLLARDPSLREELLLDVGCGSGILCFASALLGVERALGCDTDPDSVEVARENARSLDLEARCEFRAGDALCLAKRSRLVVANIEPVVLIPEAAAIAELVEPGGYLVLSGILRSQVHSVLDAYKPLGLALLGADERDDWVSPRLHRK